MVALGKQLKTRAKYFKTAQKQICEKRCDVVYVGYLEGGGKYGCYLITNINFKEI